METNAQQIAALDMARMRREVSARRFMHELQRTILLRAMRPEDEKAVDDARVEFTDKSMELMGPLFEAWEVLQQIIYASDGCMGHRDCAHSMEPWQKARQLIYADDKRRCDQIMGRE